MSSLIVAPTVEPGVNVTPLPRTQSTAKPGLRLVPTVCCLCQIEDVEPIGVGEDFEYRTSADTFLAVRCRRCELIFLDPRPADDEAGRIYPDHYHAFGFDVNEFGLVHAIRRRLEARRVLNWCCGLPANARILDVGCGDGFHLQLLRDFGRRSWTLEGADTDLRAVEAARKSGLAVHHGAVEALTLTGGYHLILMVMTVEHLADPVGVLKAVRNLLAPGGRVVIVTDNAASPDFAVFGGRHWGGYHFPRHFNLFSRVTLAKLARKADLDVDGIVTDFSPVNWVYSIRNWLDDWGAPRWLVNCFSLKSAPALAAFTLFDILLAMAGHGGILRATFRRSLTDPLTDPLADTGVTS